MQDAQLIIASNLRPAIVPNAAVTRWLFPDLIAPTYWDLLAARDLGRGAPVYGMFRIAAAFNAVANNFLRFAIFVDSTPTFVNILTNNELVVARGPDILSAGLGSSAVGMEVPVALPPLSDLVRLTGEGRRYITLGLEAYVPTTDWSSGGIDAWFSPFARSGRPFVAPAGY